MIRACRVAAALPIDLAFAATGQAAACDRVSGAAMVPDAAARDPATVA